MTFYQLCNGRLSESGTTIWCWRHGEGGHQCGDWCAAFQFIPARRETLSSDTDGVRMSAKVALHCINREIQVTEVKP